MANRTTHKMRQYRDKALADLAEVKEALKVANEKLKAARKEVKELKAARKTVETQAA